jgi:hypothetical protein
MSTFVLVSRSLLPTLLLLGTAVVFVLVVLPALLIAAGGTAN